jgi:hypothetical protein
MMSDMTQGDWFEDGTFEDALAHFDAQPSEPTLGSLPAKGRLVTRASLTLACGTLVRVDRDRPLGRVVGAVPTSA